MPGATFRSLMTRRDDDTMPAVAAVGEGGIVSGLYCVHVRMLEDGNYELQVASTGFRSFVTRGIALAVGQFARVDARLEVGEAARTVQVEGTPPLVNTPDASVSQTTGNDQITTLPLVKRTIHQQLHHIPTV